ncbi:MAG: hypothetical protein C0506_06960 [Anaerolinea sp.]|nr:hypothetical protein [Anaerolinea sp.]
MIASSFPPERPHLRASISPLACALRPGAAGVLEIRPENGSLRPMRCASPLTRTGRPCGYALEECPYPAHGPGSADPALHGRAALNRPSQVAAAAQTATGGGAGEPPAPVVNRDLRALAWWAAGALLTGAVPGREISALCTLIRVLHALGPEPDDEQEVLAELELRGVVMNGFPPRNEEEWALAERVFDADAIEEFRRWEREGKGW